MGVANGQAKPAIQLYQPSLPSAPFAGITIPIPPGQAWRIVCMRLIIRCSAAAGSRVMTVGFQIGGQEFCGVGTDIDGTAGQVFEINMGIGGNYAGSITRNWPYEGASTITYATLPDVIMPPGSTVLIGGVNFDTADVWNACNIGVEKYTA